MAGGGEDYYCDLAVGNAPAQDPKGPYASRKFAIQAGRAYWPHRDFTTHYGAHRFDVHDRDTHYPPEARRREGPFNDLL